MCVNDAVINKLLIDWSTHACRLQSARLCLCTNTTVIPGVVPEDPNFDLYDDPQQKQQLAVELADKYAANVPPVTVPEAAGRAQQSEVQADLAQSTLAFLTPTCAVVALASGQLLQLALMVRVHLGCKSRLLAAVPLRARMRTSGHRQVSCLLSIAHTA